MIHLGRQKPGSTVYIPFQTFDSNDPSASVTITGLATTDVEVYRDGDITAGNERASTAGYTLIDTDGIDLDGITGVHGLSIDLSDNTTAGYYRAGSHYTVIIASITVDAATINFIPVTFEIGYEGAFVETTVESVTSQTALVLAAAVAPPDNDVFNGCQAIIHDVATADQWAWVYVTDYDAATRTVTLAAGAAFTVAATDNISFYPPALLPTTAGNRLDVTATGAAGIDWGNVENPTTAVDLSATDIQLADTVTTLTGHTAQTGDSFARLGAPAGASIAADLVVIDNFVDGLEAAVGALADAASTGDPDTGTTLMSYTKQLVNLLAGTAGITTMPAAADPANGVNLFEMLRAAMGATFATATDSLEQLQADIVTVQADTDDIQTRLPAALVGGAMDCDVSAMQAGVITAAAVATDAIDADALATDALQEIADRVMPEQNAAYNNIPFVFRAASDGLTLVTGATGMGVERSIDGGAFAAGTGTGPTEISDGWYQYDASAADMNGGIIAFRFTGTGGTPGAPADTLVTIVTEAGT